MRCSCGEIVYRCKDLPPTGPCGVLVHCRALSSDPSARSPVARPVTLQGDETQEVRAAEAGATSSAAPATQPHHPDEGDLWAEMVEAEEAAAAASALAAGAAAERQAWCDEFERQPGLLRNELLADPIAPPLQAPPQAEAPVAQETLCSALRASLEALLELSDFGEPVAWPSGFDARTARLRLSER